MRAVVQRVLKAGVSVEGQQVASIDRGLCILVGICNEDTERDLNYIVQKILKLKLFENESGKKWSCSVVDRDLEILCVSQFTLYYSLKGNKLDFHHAMPASSSQPFYNYFLQSLRNHYKNEKIKDGKFGAMMEVSIINDGPVTIQLESPQSKAEPRTERNDSETV